MLKRITIITTMTTTNITPSNSIFALAPYKYQGTWVFDDPSKGLDKEAFVCGIDKMIDNVTVNIPNAKEGFRLLFSPNPFPGVQLSLELRRPESEGNWYHCTELDFEGWLCPALFHYFDTAPARLYAKAEALDEPIAH